MRKLHVCCNVLIENTATAAAAGKMLGTATALPAAATCCQLMVAAAAMYCVFS
jgi:hypothetical protein